MGRPIWINARWGARAESVERCAKRLAGMLTQLADLHPAFANWNRRGCRGWQRILPFCGMPPNVEELAAILDEGRYLTLAPARQPILEMGYVAFAWNARQDMCGVALNVHAGAFATHVPHPNGIELDFQLPEPGNADLLALETLKSVLRIIAASWQPDIAHIGSLRMAAEMAAYRYRADWITYLAPKLAARLSQADAAMIERQADGSLILTAGDGALDADNPAHLAQVRAAQEVLAPLN